MAKKKRVEPVGTSKRAKLLADQAVALADYAAKVYIAADERGIKKKTLKQFPLNEKERATVAALPVLPAGLKKKLEKKAVFTVVEVCSMLMAISESVVEGNWRAMLLIAMKLKDCLQENIGTSKAKIPKPTDTVYQMKITLSGVKPPIWRRIQVPDCTLLKLNKIIQACMGWEDCHMWLFDIGDEEYGDDVMDTTFESNFVSARRAKLSRFVQAGVKTFWYTYDMGDNWEHVVQIEKVSDFDPEAKYPRCVNGNRACPPEDCGGFSGYGDFLAAIQNPDHESHKEMLQWVGGQFDPEAFEIETVNSELPTLR